MPSLPSCGTMCIDRLGDALLTLDPGSPFRNCAVADQLIAENATDDTVDRKGTGTRNAKWLSTVFRFSMCPIDWSHGN
ncbi:MAG: hypothetical protein EA424_15200 [Planctomycetaceae bacterium]|nr:MAG: hypothetical protein EA424_15200 [Planctomycetaceae bacterium]